MPTVTLSSSQLSLIKAMVAESLLYELEAPVGAEEDIEALRAIMRALKGAEEKPR